MVWRGRRRRDGATITSVVDRSPAAAAGLDAGDVVTAIDGREVATPGAVTAAIPRHRPGDTAVVSVLRGGLLLRIDACLDAGCLGDN